jgi:hypothetical protein
MAKEKKTGAKPNDNSYFDKFGGEPPNKRSIQAQIFGIGGVESTGPEADLTFLDEDQILQGSPRSKGPYISLKK